MSSSRYPTKPSQSRLALLPGLLGAIILVAGLAVVGTSWYTYLQYAVAILALICCVFAYQGRQFWWFIGLVPIAVVFNPVFPIVLPNVGIPIAHLVGSIVFVAAGVTIKVTTEARR